MKCTNTKRSDRRTMAPKEGVYARPQARAVRRRKNERRYVKDGSGRCHVFLVSEVRVNIASKQESGVVRNRVRLKRSPTYVSISNQYGINKMQRPAQDTEKLLTW